MAWGKQIGEFSHQILNWLLPVPLETPWTKTVKNLAETGSPAYVGVGIGESKRKCQIG